jgi:hypothetical protein
VVRKASFEKAMAIQADHQHVCDKMIRIIKADVIENADYFRPRNIALYILARNVDYRASPEIIKTLVANVDVLFSDSIARRGFEEIDVAFPAIRGLLLVGRSATEPILQKIKNTDNRGPHGRLAYWFSKYYGKRVAMQLFNDILEENPKMPLEERKRPVTVLEFIEADAW